MKFPFNTTKEELQLHDLPLYHIVAEEIARGELDRGLWLKALTTCDGDDGKTRALYARWRTQLVYAEAAATAEAAAAAAEAKANRDPFDIPSELFDGHLNQLRHPVPVSDFATEHKLMDLEVIEQIKRGRLRGVRFEGDWYVDRPTI
jgi:hypothetical protein